MSGKLIRVTGTVQGVGFRPYVWLLARQYQLTGEVWNDANGVGIRVWGERINEFLEQLPLQAPPLAVITAIKTYPLRQPPTGNTFNIAASRSGKISTAIAADAATCPACLADISDPNNRRYRYPFTNCTHCGPRLSIVRSIPYDRANTAMASFCMCPACLAEYHNPADRRFHAQANACPDCGPQLWLQDRHGNSLPTGVGDAISETAELIQQGYIIAIKGIGGFHLACDAGNPTAVLNLRNRKQRDGKPFAIMGRDLAMLKRYTHIDDNEQHALNETAAAIVIVAKQGQTLAEAVAPDDDKLGCLLPYTPLHQCLLQALNTPIVLTSANRSNEPQCISNADACLRLTDIADYWLLHDREIINRLDDSVLRVMADKPRLLRRSRGYAPLPLQLPPGFDGTPPILAMGGELKNTFCLLQHGQAILSPHIGDLENPLAQQDYRNMLTLYQQLFDFQPQQIAVDLHPDYLSTQLGRQWAAQQGLPLIGVQHHHAHIAACMAEHGLAMDHPPVLGVAMDGLGLGDDGSLWGGEFLKVDYRQSTRLAAFDALPLIGGAQAMRQPWRNCYAHLKSYFDWQSLTKDYADVEIIGFLNRQALGVLDTMLEKSINCPPSSSCGRWFDAFAAALSLCRETVSYEGQAAIQLETLASPCFASQREQAYPFDWSTAGVLPRLSWRSFWLAVLDDLQQNIPLSLIAARIHHGLARAIAETAWLLAEQINTDMVVLSGGVFQNRLLLEEVSRLLRARGKTPLAPALLPGNDGGLAFGQAVVAGRFAG